MHMTSEHRENPPFRAEHIGSFVRPIRLIEAREGWQAGTVAYTQLSELEDECVREVVAMQERAGLHVITDGEFRKWSWRDLLFDASEGFTPSRDASDFPLTKSDGSILRGLPVPDVVNRIERRDLLAPGFGFVHGITPRTVKATLPAPSVSHFFRGDRMLAKSPYEGDRDAYLADVAGIYRQEIADLVAQGCTYLQIDDVPSAALCDVRNQAIVRERGEDPDTLIDTYFNVFRDAVKDLPSGVTLAVHLCRGNVGHGLASGGYEELAERLFNLPAHVFFLEYDTERAGGFEPLRHLPSDRRAVLGMVSTKIVDLEPIDELRRRFDQASKFVELDRLSLSPQCGFSSAYNTGSFTEADEERKLVHLVAAADSIWGSE
jgi:5-methyltetrahydropteroyltriglutamate--homocysteine methyltransferase